jgi:hypothetical protein
MMFSAALLASLSLAGPVRASPKGCPPGLAKKNVPCVPPGQAKKGLETAPYKRGDVIYHDYVIIRDPRRYGLDPDETYYNANGYVFRVNRETREVLDLIGAIAAVLD